MKLENAVYILLITTGVVHHCKVETWWQAAELWVWSCDFNCSNKLQ